MLANISFKTWPVCEQVSLFSVISRGEIFNFLPIFPIFLYPLWFFPTISRSSGIPSVARRNFFSHCISFSCPNLFFFPSLQDISFFLSYFLRKIHSCVIFRKFLKLIDFRILFHENIPFSIRICYHCTHLRPENSFIALTFAGYSFHLAKMIHVSI